MTITIEKLLQKMEQELKEAKASSAHPKIRERIQAIKVLCELVLDEPVKEPPVLEQSRPYSVQSTATNRLELEADDANGESLFDF